MCDISFDVIVRTHCSTLRPKPAPDVFVELASQLEVEPASCIVLEDSVPGCEAAIAGRSVVVPVARYEGVHLP